MGRRSAVYCDTMRPSAKRPSVSGRKRVEGHISSGELYAANGKQRGPGRRRALGDRQEVGTWDITRVAQACVCQGKPG